jgi:hypothetical protein
MKRLLGIVFFVGIIFAAQEPIQTDLFVRAKKKEPRLSPSTLKNKIGQNFATLLKKQSELTCVLAQLNNELVDRTAELLDNACDGSVTQLDRYAQELCAFEKELAAFSAQAKQMLGSLKKGLPSTASGR